MMEGGITHINMCVKMGLDNLDLYLITDDMGFCFICKGVRYPLLLGRFLPIPLATSNGALLDPTDQNQRFIVTLFSE